MLIWDGTSISRRNVFVKRAPDAFDWETITKELIRTQKTINDIEGIKCKVGWFQCPNVPGNYSVIGLGFKPKLVKFYVAKLPGTQAHFCCGTGVMDELGNQGSMTWAGIANNAFRGNSSIEKVISTTNVNTITVEANYISMDEDGFTINFTIVNPLFIVQWEAIG